MSASHDSVRTAYSPGVCPRPAKPPGLLRARHLARCCLACLLVLFALVRPLRACAATNARAAFQSDAIALEAGSRIQRTLAGGEAQLFRLTLDAGRYVHVVVEQQGIDVVVALIDPSKHRALEIDSPNGSSGPESLSFVAEASGEYFVEVRSPGKGAAAGGYEISVEALRDPTPSDLARVRAERTFSEAFRRAARPEAATRRAALEQLEAILPVFRSLEDRAMETLTLNSIALGYHSAGELPKALRYYNEALPISRALGDRNGEARLLNNIGGVYDILGEPQAALDYYGQALGLWRILTNATAQGDTLNNVGVIYYNLGDLQQALDYYNQALPYRKAGASRRREADTLGNVGLVYVALGEPQRALEYLQDALRLRRETKDIQGEATSLHYLGVTYAVMGDTAKARDYFNQSLPLRRTAGDHRGEAATLNSIGAAYSASGEPEKAVEHHEQALRLFREIGDRRGEAQALGYLGQASALAGRRRQAAEHYGQAISIFQALGDKRSEAWARQGVALVERDSGDLAAARAQIEAAVSLVEAMRAKVVSPQLRTSFFAAKQDTYEFYIDLLMRLHRLDPSRGYDAAAFQISERARARQLLEVLSELNVDIRQGVDPPLLERERRLSRLLDAKTERLIRLQGQQRTAEQVAALKQEVGGLEAEYQQVQGDIRRRSPHYASLTQPLPLGPREIQQQLLDEETLLLEYSLGTERSYLWAVTRDSLKSYELPGRAEIEKTARRLYGLVTARGVRRREENARQRQERIRRADMELREAAAELSRMTLAPVASELNGRRLAIVPDGALQYISFAMLTAADGARPMPAAPPAPPAERAAQAVAGVYRPLILDHEIVTLPSASALAVQRRELAGRAPAPYQVAVIADPVFESTDARVALKSHGAGRPVEAQPPDEAADSDATRLLEHLTESAAALKDWAGGKPSVPRLPYTRREAEQILAVASGGRNLRAVDFEASRATALGGELRRYRYVHFATHGYIDSEKPGRSAIVLSLVDERGKAQDGLLKAREIYNLHLPAELVVLSACQTGLGKEIRGEGMVGLTRGFMYAGAARIIVSLWSVSDRGTADLMWRLYRGMIKDGRRPSSALRAAQVEMWKQTRWQSPYYWAAFVQQGEWR
jgi:CHAT domain-containing protein/tetratricopeptide (TPR) repeat protein